MLIGYSRVTVITMDNVFLTFSHYTEAAMRYNTLPASGHDGTRESAGSYKSRTERSS